MRSRLKCDRPGIVLNECAVVFIGIIDVDVCSCSLRQNGPSVYFKVIKIFCAVALETRCAAGKNYC